MGRAKPRVPSFDRLLEDLYASVLEPARFDDFAASLRLAMNSHLIAVQTDNSDHRHNVLQHYSDCAIAVEAPDHENDASINQYFAHSAHKFAERGVLNGSDFFAKGELERTAFYREVLSQLDVHYSAGICMADKPGGELVALSISRDKRRPDFCDADMRFLHRLLPHVRNAYTLQQRLRQLENTAAATDQLSQPIILLDRNGEILRTNAEAERWFVAADQGIHRCGQRLGAVWHPDKAILHRAIAAAVASCPQRSEVLLHDAQGQGCAVCHCHPLHPASLHCWMLSESPRAIVFLRPLDGPSPAPREVLRQVFQLTMAEADLACCLLQHGSLAACRDALGKSHETLRTQLKMLFAKTDTCRQAELLQRLQSACP